MAANPYPMQLRVHLARSRSTGLGFAEAWTRALAEVPGPGCVWPRVRRFFQAGYDRQAPPHDATVLVEDSPLVYEVSVTRPAAGAPHTCRSGDGCPRDVLPGERFCAIHLGELTRIRLDLERGDLGARRRQRPGPPLPSWAPASWAHIAA